MIARLDLREQLESQDEEKEAPGYLRLVSFPLDSKRQSVKLWLKSTQEFQTQRIAYKGQS